MNYQKRLEKILSYLKTKRKILFITTSNRWEDLSKLPKSTLLAKDIAKRLGKKAKLIDATKLEIFNCEGNVSDHDGNHCGPKHALLRDRVKNPSQCHRCWASINHPNDELWKISRELLKSDCVIFFSSVRWGQTNAIYQKLIERLTWLENRHSTLGEDNILRGIDAGLIILGQNWNGRVVLKTQRKVLGFFGFNTPKLLFLNWQYTKNYLDENPESYKNAFQKFLKDFGLKK